MIRIQKNTLLALGAVFLVASLGSTYAAKTTTPSGCPQKSQQSFDYDSFQTATLCYNNSFKLTNIPTKQSALSNHICFEVQNESGTKHTLVIGGPRGIGFTFVKLGGSSGCGDIYPGSTYIWCKSQSHQSVLSSDSTTSTR